MDQEESTMLSKAEQVAELRKARAARAEAAAKGTHASKAKAPRKARGAAKGRSTAAAGPLAARKAARPGSKLEKIAKLLTRPEGCTTAEILKACHWPAVSVPQQARALGIKLRSKREGRALRYWAA